VGFTRCLGTRVCRRGKMRFVSHWVEHLPIVPIVLPLATAVLLLLLDERRRALRSAISLVPPLTLLGVPIAILRSANAPTSNGSVGTGVYLLGIWPAPF